MIEPKQLIGDFEMAKNIDWGKKLKNLDGHEVYKMPNGIRHDITVQRVSTYSEEEMNETYIEYWVYTNTGLPCNNALGEGFSVTN
jgi:hypothetical protein